MMTEPNNNNKNKKKMIHSASQEGSRGKGKPKPSGGRNSSSNHGKRGSASSSVSPYSVAANLLNQCWQQRVSLKSLVYCDGNSKKKNHHLSSSEGGRTTTTTTTTTIATTTIATMTCSKTAFAQASNVLTYQNRLQSLQQQFDLQAQNQGLLFVLLYELLEGPNKSIKGGGALKRRLLDQEQDLRQAWEEQSSADKAKHSTSDSLVAPSSSSSSSSSHPRYLRVNTLLSTTSQVLKELTQRNIPHQLDTHIPDLVAIPTKDAHTTTQLLELGPKVILQDKSSCFAAWCLVHGYDDDDSHSGLDRDNDNDNEYEYLDACAAPGNKTMHLAALLAAKGDSSSHEKKHHPTTTNTTPTTTIHAFDKDARRCRDLQHRVAQHVGDNNQNVRIHVKCQDFLSVQPNDYAKVRAILLDPTCSGSGCRDGDNNDNDDRRRLRSLAAFQTSALLHAMTFPNCRRIVYSTCSVHSIENEHVVVLALHQQTHRGEWKLVSPRCLTSWERRGCQRAANSDKDNNDENGSSSSSLPHLTDTQLAALIRVDPNLDDTGGFFVACLERSNADPSSSIRPVAVAVVARPTKRPVSTDGTPAAPLGAATSKKAKSSAESSRSNPAASRHSAPSSENTKATDTHTAKRLKKQAWKQRQREGKQRRLLQKAQS